MVIIRKIKIFTLSLIVVLAAFSAYLYFGGAEGIESDSPTITEDHLSPKEAYSAETILSVPAM